MAATITPVIFSIGTLSACLAGEKPETTAPPESRPSAPIAQTDPGESAGPDTGGHGAQAVSPSLITISWRPNSESDLAGYRIYKNGAIIALVQGNVTTYADRDVVPAKMYSYFLTAFDIAGNESNPSATYRATTPPPAMSPLSFASDVFPILQSQCSSCHAAFAMADTAYTRLTAMAGGPCAGRHVVVPGNASASLLFQKATGSQDCGETPPSGPLSSAQASIVGAWINQGGLNN